MNITLKRLGTILLLTGSLASTSVAFGQSRYQGNGWGSGAHNDRHQDRRGDDRRQSFDRNENGGGRQDQSRRDSRLSPDERRALRQQIDEAGRDIYAPRRR